MQDSKLYEQILGLADPWSVQRVDLDVAGGRVEVFVEHRPDATWHCPHCRGPCPLHDHGPERTWRHLDTCQLQTHLHARPPRVRCPQHGVCNVTLPWAEAGSRFTLFMERFVIDVLQHCRNISSACRLTGLTWSQCSRLMHRAVRRGLRRRGRPISRYLGVDEKRYRRGHVYATVVSDVEDGAVLEVIDGHKQADLALFYRGLNDEQRHAVEAVAMDMHKPYIAATREGLPGGEDKIVFDRFHIMKNANAELERVRCGENRQLIREGNTTLQRARQMLLWAEENRPAKYKDHFQRLKEQDLRTGKAWAMKESLRRLWDAPSVRLAREYFTRWRQWVVQSGIQPMQRLARNLAARLEGIIRYAQHPITTAGCEGINSRISEAQHRAAGYRSFERLRTAILFFCGKLSLYP
jgi:transposase